MLNNNFEYKVHNKTINDEGRYIFLDIELPDVARFLIINLYAPNKDTPMKIKNDPSCPYCDINSETLLHAFINCAAVIEFWKSIESWFQQVVEIHTKIGDIEKIIWSVQFRLLY